MKSIIYLSLLMVAITITSCKKKTTEVDETGSAVITMTSPLENQSFNHGDTVKINGTIVSEAVLHGYQVRLVNLSTGSIVLNQDYHVHEASIAFSESWKNMVSDTTQMKIIIEAAIDHDGNLSTMERLITCYPQ